MHLNVILLLFTCKLPLQQNKGIIDSKEKKNNLGNLRIQNVLVMGPG